MEVSVYRAAVMYVTGTLFVVAMDWLFGAKFLSTPAAWVGTLLVLVGLYCLGRAIRAAFPLGR